MKEQKAEPPSGLLQQGRFSSTMEPRGCSMKTALALLMAAVASAALAESCPPVDPAEVERLRQVCASVMAGDVEVRFHALAEGAKVGMAGVEAPDHTDLAAALERAAAKVDPASVLVAVNVRFCRVNADPQAENECGPERNLLNTGIQSYDPNRETHDMLGYRPSFGLSIGRRLPKAEPPAYAELRCVVLSKTGPVHSH